jgi:hypothetical protein
MDDIRVIEASSQASFSEEHLGELWIRNEMVFRDFENNEFAETTRPSGYREKDLGRGASSQLS